jgi:hypothetical protein
MLHLAGRGWFDRGLYRSDLEANAEVAAASGDA